MDNKKGFTLIELLTVIVVVAILAGLTIMTITRYLEESKERVMNTSSLNLIESIRRSREIGIETPKEEYNILTTDKDILENELKKSPWGNEYTEAIITVEDGEYRICIKDSNNKGINATEDELLNGNVETHEVESCENEEDKNIGKEYNFSYINPGKGQKYSVPYDGNYKIELWGAGLSKLENYSNGAYTKGIIQLKKDDVFYLYIGNKSGSTTIYNGGGIGSVYQGGSTNKWEYTGEGNGNGATDIRLLDGEWNDNASLISRIMVAGAGGGGNNKALGEPNGVATTHGDKGSAGGLISYDGTYGYHSGYNGYKVYTGKAATQFSGGDGGYSEYCNTYGEKGSFGKGGDGGNGCQCYMSYAWGTGQGGGSGYYGGGGAGGSAGGYWSSNGSAGGTSFISGHTGCVAVLKGTTTPRKDSNNISCNSSASSGYESVGYNTDNTCSIHHSNKKFTNTLMIDGQGYSWVINDGILSKTQVKMPKPDGTLYELGIGHTGDGFAKITYLGK